MSEIKINIKGKEFVLTNEEAEKLKKELNKSKNINDRFHGEYYG